MQLSKNAAGNLINRYKAVLKKCLVLNAFGSLAIIGLLCAGGVAQAAAPEWGADKNVSITEDITLDASKNAKNLTISNGTLLNAHRIYATGETLLSGGTLSLTGKGGLIGSSTDAFTDTTGTFKITGGALNVGADSQGSQLQVDKVTIAGGTVKIVGKVGDISNTWTDNSMIYGGMGATTGAGVVITGGDITIGKNGQIGVGRDSAQTNSIDISGGTLKLSGDSAANAAMIRASSTSADEKNATNPTTKYAVLNISNTANIEAVAGKHGAIVSRQTNMSGGTLNVNGDLTVAGSIGTGADIAAGIGAAAKHWGTFNLTGGAINVAETGKLQLYKDMSLVIDGGNVTDAGRIYATGETILKSGSLNLTGQGGLIGSSTDAFSDVTGTFAMTGGTLNVGKTDGTQGSQMQVSKVTIAGGTVNIQGQVGDANANGKWIGNSMIYGGMATTQSGAAAGVVITGGTINIGKNGQIGVGYDTTHKNSMDISGGTLTLAGDTAANAAMLRASNDSAEASNGGSPNKYSVINISNAANIEVAAGKYGALVSRETNMKGGTLNVNGALTVAGAIDKAGTDIADGIADAGAKWGTFNLSGGTVNVGANGLLDFVTGAVTLNAKGGNLNTGASALNVTSKTIAAGSKGAYVSTLNVSKAFTVSNLHIDGVTANKGIANVESGGALVVAGSTTVATGSDTKALDIKSGGSMTASAGDFLGSDFKAKNAAVKAATSIDGILYLRTTSDFKYTAANLTTADGDLAGSGHVGFLGGTLVDASGNATNAEITTSNGTSTANSITPNNTLEVKGSQTNAAALTGVIAAKNISVDADVATLTVTNTTLTGSGSGSLISNGKAEAPTVALAANGALNLGIAGNTVAQGGSLGAITTDAAGGAITSTEGSYTIKSITGNTGADILSVNSANLSVGDIDTKTGADQINIVGGNLNANSITLGDNTASISVGNSSNSGNLVAESLKLNGATLFADPAWGLGASSTVAVKNIGTDGKTVDGIVIAGQNSHITIGLADNGAWMANNLRYGAVGGVLSAGGTTAAMGIYKPLTVNSNGAILVDGSQTDKTAAETTAGTNKATFAANSLLAVYAPNTLTTAALTSTAGTLVVDTNSKLMVVDGKVGNTVKILDGFTGSAPATAWSDANLLTNSSMLTGTGTWNATTGKYDVSITRGKSAQELFPLLDGETAGMVNKMYDQGVNDTQSSMAGIRFLSRATANNEKYVANADEAAATIEGAARLSVAGATQGMTISAVNAGTAAATSRTSMASPLQSQKPQVVALNGETTESGMSAGDVRNGVGLWIMPLYQSNNTWGMKAGEFKTGYTSDLGGVALGADYTINDAIRFGVAFNMGGGYAQSHGDFNKTDNSFNFWGVNLYGGWTQNNFGLTADVGYTGNYNKVKQELPSSMQMNDIKADVTSSAITAGLRGEYKIATEAVDIIPHVAVRYMSLKTDSYDAKSNGTVFSADESFQNIWTFPIGVTFAKEIENSSGWTFRPQVDLQVIPAAGDVKAKSKVRVPGIDASADLSTRVMDDISYGGGIGFDVRKDNVSFGLNYNIQASEHSTAHGVFGTVRYEF